jgi:hypothetical protein
MRLVKQREKGECGLACIAMVLGVSLKEAIRMACITIENHDYLLCPGVVDLEWGSRGMTDEEVIEVLRAYGAHAKNGPDWTDLAQAAILIVPSLNHRGLLHYVVWDPEAEQYLDPGGPLVYPDHGPDVNGVRVCWARAIIVDPIFTT